MLWDHFWTGTCQKCFRNLSFRVRSPLKSQKNVARYSSSRLAYARRDLASKSRVSCTPNYSFTWAAEAEALERALSSQGHCLPQTHASKFEGQANFAKLYIPKLPIHRHRAAVTRNEIMGPVRAHGPKVPKMLLPCNDLVVDAQSSNRGAQSSI